MNRREVIAGLALPLLTRSAWAQQPSKVYRIAIVGVSRPASDLTEAREPVYATFFGELRRLGYVEGKNLHVERRSPEGRPERTAEIARELLALRPDLIFAYENELLRLLNGSTIPVVGVLGADPVTLGFAASLARPGGNITGLSGAPDPLIREKYFEILKAIRPQVEKVAILTVADCEKESQCPLFRAAAIKAGVSIVGPPLRTPVDAAEYPRVIPMLKHNGAGAMIVTDIVPNYFNLELIIELAAALGLPAIYEFHDAAKRGGLVNYAADRDDRFRRLAQYVAKVLEGAKPAEMPIYRETHLRLAINVKTAKALGLTIPDSLLVRADEVIE
jgi:ABC-type uncharacterized transport system substrate-binding protein